MQSIFFTLSLLLVSLPTWAVNHSAGLMSTASGHSPAIFKVAPPETKPGVKVIRYSQALEHWQDGRAPSQDLFDGNWRQVGFNTNVDCAYLGADVTDLDGLHNGDGSPNGYLTVRTDIEDDFDETPVEITLAYLHNLGNMNADQGPLDVTISREYPQFAQYAYKGDVVYYNAQFEHNCRLLVNNSNRMVCGLTFRDSNPQTIDEQRCVDQMGAFRLYIRD